MIKIGNEKVNKIIINNKEVLKVYENNLTTIGVLKYQSASATAKGRYVLAGNITGGAQTFQIIDTNDDSLLWQGTVSTSISSFGNGLYAINYDFIYDAIRAFGANYSVITNLIYQPAFQITITRRTSGYLKAYYNTTYNIFTTNFPYNTTPSTARTITWDSNTITSNYWDQETYGIEDIGCRLKQSAQVSSGRRMYIQCYSDAAMTTPSTNLTGITNIGVLVFFNIKN